jgi:hypothetical protein
MSITSRPYKPDSAKCCERCVFGSGEHAEWCEKLRAEVILLRVGKILDQLAYQYRQETLAYSCSLGRGWWYFHADKPLRPAPIPGRATTLLPPAKDTDIGDAVMAVSKLNASEYVGKMDAESLA